MRATLLVSSAGIVQKVEITCFLVVGYVLAYDEPVWNGVTYRILLLIGRIFLRKGVEAGGRRPWEEFFVGWCWVPLFIKFGRLEMLFGMEDRSKLKNRCWNLSSGKSDIEFRVRKILRRIWWILVVCVWTGTLMLMFWYN
jgi:hypothetical protein